jgi:hypothetical protein
LDKSTEKGKSQNGKSEKEATMVKPLFEIPPVRRVTRHMEKQEAPKIVGLAPMYPQGATHEDPIPVDDDDEDTFPISQALQSC